MSTEELARCQLLACHVTYCNSTRYGFFRRLRLQVVMWYEPVKISPEKPRNWPNCGILPSLVERLMIYPLPLFRQ